MARIDYFFSDGHVEQIEVSEEFSVQYAEMERHDHLTERKETRRHQSLDKSLEHGFDIPDPNADVQSQAERNEEWLLLLNALSQLTDKQRVILVKHAVDKLSFREIGDKLGLHKDTVREHYLAAIKKMKKVLENTPSKPRSRGF